MTSETKICVVGTGHIGLPLAAVLAEAGFRVTGYDTNDDFIVRVNTTRTVDFQEEGLAALLERNLHNRLTLRSQCKSVPHLPAHMDTSTIRRTIVLLTATMAPSGSPMASS